MLTSINLVQANALPPYHTLTSIADLQSTARGILRHTYNVLRQNNLLRSNNLDYLI